MLLVARTALLALTAAQPYDPILPDPNPLLFDPAAIGPVPDAASNVTDVELAHASNVTDTDLAHASNATATELASASNVTEAEVAPASNVTETELAPASNVTQTELAHASNATATELASASNVIEAEVAPASNVTETELAHASNVTDVELGRAPDQLHLTHFHECPQTTLSDLPVGVDPHELLTHVELRWSRDGHFDGIYLVGPAAEQARAGPCKMYVYSALQRAWKLKTVLEQVRAHGPRTMRYFPSDTGLANLYGCEYADVGATCNESRVMPSACPAGAHSPLLVHTQFTAHTWPSVSCVHLIPNMYQLLLFDDNLEANRSYAGARATQAYDAAGNLTHAERPAKLLFVGRQDCAAAAPEACGMRQRQYLHSFDWPHAHGAHEWLELPAHMEITEAARYRYLLDIGGSSGTTWDALQWKLASGALVFKVRNAQGAADLWHAQLHHRKHLLEVAADFSDLHELVAWARANPTEAEQIAQRGQEVAMANVGLEPQMEALKRVVEGLR